MAVYTYQSMDADGKIIRGKLDAVNPADLEMRLKRMELDLIDCAPAKPRTSIFARRVVTRQDMINFCFHMEQMTGAGVPILESLADLRDSTTNARLREVIADLIENVKGGLQLSEALVRHSSIFDKTFTSLIFAGESSGKIPEVFKSLSESLKWQDELASRTKKIVMYPAFVGTVVVGVLFFLMIFLVPQLIPFIKSMGQETPLNTRILIFVSDVFIHYWYAILAFPFAVFAGYAFLVKTNPRARYKADEYKLKIWMVGPVLRKIILARFATFFAMMYASGITILDCIRLSEDIASNQVIANGLRRAGQLIREGQGISAAFEYTGIFPPLVIRMFKVGEATGSLDVALRNVSYFYDREVKEMIEKVEAMIEPVLTVILGGLLGWIAMSLLGPIYDTLSKLKI